MLVYQPGYVITWWSKEHYAYRSFIRNVTESCQYLYIYTSEYVKKYILYFTMRFSSRFSLRDNVPVFTKAWLHCRVSILAMY